MRARAMWILMAAAVLTAAVPLWAAGGALDAKVDALVKAEMEKQHIPGVSLMVLRAGKPVRAQGYGFANLEHQVPVKPETIFESGSVGKQFTATAVMLLAEQGKIDLNAPITKYLGEGPESWNKVTVRMLLSHTGGFGDYDASFDMRKDYTEAELLKLVEAIPLAYEPGTSWSYSNLGYLTLGVLIHRVSGQFYGDYLQEHVFRPLGMSSTRIISEADLVPNRAAGYRWVNGEWKNQEWVSPTLNTTADGSLYLNTVDLAKWDAALYTEKVLKRSSLEQMWTVVPVAGKPNKGNYGYGWFIEEQKGHKRIGHDGAWQGFVINISRYVNDKLTVIVLTNLERAEPGVIAHGVADLYFAEK